MKQGLRARFDTALPKGTRRFTVMRAVFRFFAFFPAVAKESRRIGFSEVVRRLLYAWFGCRKELTMSDGERCRLHVQDAKRIDVLSPVFTVFIARLIQRSLTQAGILCEIFTEPLPVYEDILYIVICPYVYPKLPTTYAAFQMEQTTSARWQTDEYRKALYNAVAVFDYAKRNIAYFSMDKKLAGKLYYMPLDYLSGMTDGEETEKAYDVVFYGAMNERRQAFLQKLAKRFTVRILSECFSDDLYRELRRARVLVNVHYYENAVLETTRLYEALSLNGCVIVSERSCTPEEEQRMEGLVDFVDMDDITQMCNRIDYWVTHPEECERKLRENRQMQESRENEFGTHFRLFLAENGRSKGEFEDIQEY